MKKTHDKNMKKKKYTPVTLGVIPVGADVIMTSGNQQTEDYSVSNTNPIQEEDWN